MIAPKKLFKDEFGYTEEYRESDSDMEYISVDALKKWIKDNSHFIFDPIKDDDVDIIMIDDLLKFIDEP